MSHEVTHPQIQLLTPENDIENPTVSIVVPALNEEINIGEFVSWCFEGLKKSQTTGEVLIVDSSDDATAQIALSGGARVLRCPRRGLGRAYIDALPFVRGDWIIMGDADCTYDFREIEPFVEGFKQGNEFVMGSRWKGSIEEGSMPPHHQYFGTPLTTWILNRLYSSEFSDIHCGMRGITRGALENMQLQSQSWEYASEMVLKSVHMGLRTTEVPVHFLKDRNGRVSHHRREGWWSPFSAAWINLRAMFVYGVDFFTFVPGIFLALIGLLLTGPSTFGAVNLGPVKFSILWQMLGMTLFSIGLVGIYAGIVSRILFDYTGDFSKKWTRRLSYTRTAAASALIFMVGICLSIPLLQDYITNNLALPSTNNDSIHLAITGLTSILASVITFVFMLLVHASNLASRFRLSSK